MIAGPVKSASVSPMARHSALLQRFFQAVFPVPRGQATSRREGPRHSLHARSYY